MALELCHTEFADARNSNMAQGKNRLTEKTAVENPLTDAVPEAVWSNQKSAEAHCRIMGHWYPVEPRVCRRCGHVPLVGEVA